METIKSFCRKVRTFFTGEQYAVSLFIAGGGVIRQTITAPNERRAMEEAEEMADPGCVLSCKRL